MNLEQLLSRLAYIADMYGGEGLPKDTEISILIELEGNREIKPPDPDRW